MTDAEQYSEYSLLLEKTQRRIKQYAQQKFVEFNFGITVDQWMVLKQLYPSSNLSQSQLAEITYKGMPTLNGEPLNRAYRDCGRRNAGAMGPEPNKAWSSEDVPPSMDEITEMNISE
ncbi:MAG: hypothetical protein RIG62_01490 [Cyclobacteriaceae bacterium]